MEWKIAYHFVNPSQEKQPLLTTEKMGGMNAEKLNRRNAYHRHHTFLVSSPFLLNDREFAFSPVQSPFLLKTEVSHEVLKGFVEHPPPYTETQIRSAKTI